MVFMTGLIAIFVFLYGMVFTSFFDVVGTRLPKGESLLGRSHCDHCHKQLRFLDVIPILGYVINHGKCRSCQERIPLIHLCIEIIGGLFFMIAYVIDGFSISFWIAAIMISVLIIESIADMTYQVVIDRIWIIGVIPLIIIQIVKGSWLIHGISSLAIFSFLLLLSLVYQKTIKKEVLGGGDIKLYFFIGWILTPALSFLSLFIAAFVGLIYSVISRKRTDQYLPLVPFIFIGVWISYYFGDWLIDSYLSLLRM